MQFLLGCDYDISPMHGYFSYKSMDEEKRKLHINVALYKRAWITQKKNTDFLQEENHKLQKEIARIEKEKVRLEEELEKIKQERDTYKGMVFKANRHTLSSAFSKEQSGRKRGGQIGHAGHGRKNSVSIDKRMHAYLSRCPTCQTKLQRVHTVSSHTVSDLPHWSMMQPVTTQYTVERQWCKTCKKEVAAVPVGVIPGSKLGINLMTMVLVWRYRLRLPMAKITELLQTMYGIPVSEGAIASSLSQAKQFLGQQYDKLFSEIRGSPLVHADETGWRINGKNSWAWTFVTPKTTLFTIEQTRGKGIPEEKLKHAVGVLVRDDYAGYQKLPLPQQSCWAHLLRKSHEAALQEHSSEEIKQLHKTLKDLFDLLAEDLGQPFNLKQRQELYGWYTTDIQKIINKNYTAVDAKRIQARINNQGTNLITALLYPGVPLTNNAAEKAIRPLVVTRKISGGNQSREGATIHAINMSIVETICKQKLPLLDTLQTYLLQGAAGKN